MDLRTVYFILEFLCICSVLPYVETITRVISLFIIDYDHLNYI